MTLTAAVNLAGETLKPHLLGTGVLKCREYDLWLMSSSFAYESPANGRQTLTSFTNYAPTILANYVRQVRSEAARFSLLVRNPLLFSTLIFSYSKIR